MSITFNGGTFQRFLPAGQDCYPSDLTPAQLQCLTFSLPATVTVPEDDINKNNALTNQMTFAESSPACGGSDFASRLTTSYGHNITDLAMQGLFNRNVEPYDLTAFTVVFTASLSGGKRSVLNTKCMALWIPVNKSVQGKYVSKYNNPICGGSAPKLVDNTLEARFKLSSPYVDDDEMIKYPKQGDFSTVLSEAYGNSAKTIKSQFISVFEFKIIVSSSVETPTAENSCVYNYIAVDRKISNRIYSLLDYDIRTQPLMPGANIKDGCIDDFFFASQPMFKNSSAECGSHSAGARFQRYFGDSIDGPNIFVLDEANIFLNFTVNNDGRRDAGDISFHYFDKSFIPTTTIASTSISTTLSTSTMVSSSAVVSTALDASTVSVNTASTVIASLSASTVISSVSTTSAIASVKGSVATTISTSVASNAASTTVATPTVVPTGYVAPTGYSGPTVYGVPAAANNIYKSASAGVVGMVSAFIVSLLFAF
ncbi:hypothetical protein HDU79_010008 [Rhizoclosmatium sp. JEL0117]|nr:hypothetical protein HDU79_010008 [Rhizoclosmatium sp. JEL0117]